MRLWSLAFGSALTCLAGLALGLVPACGAQSDGTGGRRITLKTRIALEKPAKPTAEGWTVQINRALISIGAFYYFDGEPIFSRATQVPKRGWDPFAPLRIKSAFAHPGHYIAGNALGEMISPDVVDFASSPVDLAVGNGVTGTVHSARFVFGVPPKGRKSSDIGSLVLVFEGSASKAADVRLFRAEATVDDVLDASGTPNVEGCPFTEAMLDDGTVTVTVSPAIMLDQVPFEAVGTAGSATRTVLAGPPQLAFARGIKKGTAYQFSFSKT